MFGHNVSISQVFCIKSAGIRTLIQKRVQVGLLSEDGLVWDGRPVGDDFIEFTPELAYEIGPTAELP